jgi:hypothetical protein
MFNESTVLCEPRLIGHGNACNGPPLDAPGSPINLTVLKRRLESFICQQGWPEQSAVRGVRAQAAMTQSVL